MRDYTDSPECEKCGNSYMLHMSSFYYVHFRRVGATPEHLRVTCARCEYTFWMKTKDTK